MSLFAVRTPGSVTVPSAYAGLVYFAIFLHALVVEGQFTQSGNA
jgi:hypothetical protein